MVRLVMVFEAGIAPNELAERFGINIKSVRKQLRLTQSRL
jgi:DNA-binding CsgD family transcriptional regulator